MTPIFPPKATRDEIPSAVIVFADTWKGVPHVASLPCVELTMTTFGFPCVQVAQSWPVESLSITRDSELVLLICAGKPPSRLYVSLPAL